MKETVSLPNNICALWWQTHNLSKVGHHAHQHEHSGIQDIKDTSPVCSINFGRCPVPIHPETVMARLMFFQVSTDVAKPYVNKLSDSDYDYDVHSLANSGPASFLMVGEIATHLQDEKEKAIRDLAEEKTNIATEFESQKNAIVSTFDEEKRKIINELKADAPTYFRKSFTWAGVGFVILVALTVCVPWIQKWTRPNLDDSIAEAVDKRLLKNFEVPANVLPDAVISLNKRIDDLNAKIDALDKQSPKKQ